MTPRITLCNRLFWPKRFGGLENVLWRYANAIADTGTHLHVITESVEDQPVQEQVRQGLTIHRHAPPDFGRFWRMAALIQMRWWQKALKQAPLSSVYWANEPTAATAIIRLGLGSRLLYRPVFCYEAMTHVANTEPVMAPLKRSRLACAMDRYAYKHAELVIDESHNLHKQHQQYYGKRSRALVIPNPAQPPTATPDLRRPLRLSSHHFVIGFVGRPGDPCKDLPFLINALQSQPIPDHLRLLIVGAGSQSSAARQWIDDAGLAPYTRWTGDLENPAPAYATMDTLVLPSRFETFGNVIVEAHAHGLPTLARGDDFDSTPPIYTASTDLIDHGVTGYVVDPHTPSDLGTKLCLLANNRAIATKMGHTAKKRSASYTWPDAAQRYLQALGLEAHLGAPNCFAA